MTCAHIAQAGSPAPQSSEGCQDCLAVGHHDWVHLRECLTCGRVGCCDSSPGKHASAHFRAIGHPVIRSLERGESWRWCMVDQELG
jgi:hypothetical protein